MQFFVSLFNTFIINFFIWDSLLLEYLFSDLSDVIRRISKFNWPKDFSETRRLFRNYSFCFSYIFMQSAVSFFVNKLI